MLLPNQPSLCATQQTHSTNDSTMTTTYVKNQALTTLVDSGSDLTFISEKVAKKLKLFILPAPSKTVTLADQSQLCPVVGEVVLDITVNGTLYTSQVVLVLKNLFVEMIIGKDFMKRHKSVTLHFGGSEPAI